METLEKANATRYLTCWTISFRILFGWSIRKTISWAQRWKSELEAPGEAGLFYHRGPLDYVAEEVVRLHLPAVRQDDRPVVARRVSQALTEPDKFCDIHANWDPIEARAKVERTLLEYGATLPPSGISKRPHRPKTKLKGDTKIGEELFGDSQFFLLSCVAEGALCGIERAVKQGAGLDDAGLGNWTPVMVAIRQNRQESLKWLIAHGANVNAVNQDGRKVTGLMLAAESGNVSIVKELLRAGAFVDAPDYQGRTALYFAAQSCRAEALRALLKAGARLPQDTAAIVSMLWGPTFRRRLDILRLLVSAGIHPKSYDELLGAAVELGDPEVVRFYRKLIEERA